MSPTLHWIAAPPASPLHAAAMVASSLPLADAELAARLSPIVAATNAEIARAKLDRAQFWNEVVPWGAGLAPPAAPELYAQLANSLQSCDANIDGAELLLRGGPLREAWEARGPGLWHALRRFTHDDQPAPTAQVILVRPVLGGGGCAFPHHTAFSFEAMLASPQRELPEVVRLGWLVAQLRYVNAQVSAKHSSRALIPPLLAAAEEVELARCDLPTLCVALRAWHLESDDGQAQKAATQLWAWWQTVREQPNLFAESVAAFTL